MSEAGIKSLSHTHVAIVDHLLAHPTQALADVAKHFGYTQPWLSCIIHSDAFQAMLKEKQGVAFHHTILPIKEKMVALAHAALDKTAKLMETETELRDAHEVAESMLDRLGYGAKPVGGVNLTINQQNNMVTPNSNADEIARAREAMRARTALSLGVQVNGVNIPLAVPRKDSAEMGETIIEGSFSCADGSDGTAEGRTAVRAESPSEALA